MLQYSKILMHLMMCAPESQVATNGGSYMLDLLALVKLDCAGRPLTSYH